MAYTLGLSFFFLATLIIILWDNGFLKKIFSSLTQKKTKLITNVETSEFDARMSNKELCYVAKQRASNHAEKVNEDFVKETGKVILLSSHYLDIENAAFNLFSEQVEPDEC